MTYPNNSIIQIERSENIHTETKFFTFSKYHDTSLVHDGRKNPSKKSIDLWRKDRMDRWENGRTLQRERFDYFSECFYMCSRSCTYLWLHYLTHESSSLSELFHMQALKLFLPVLVLKIAQHWKQRLMKLNQHMY